MSLGIVMSLLLTLNSYLSMDSSVWEHCGVSHRKWYYWTNWTFTVSGKFFTWIICKTPGIRSIRFGVYICQNLQLQKLNSNDNNYTKTNILVLHNSWRVAAKAVGIYLFKVNNENTKTMFEICSKLTIKKTEPCQWCRSRCFY